VEVRTPEDKGEPPGRLENRWGTRRSAKVWRVQEERGAARGERGRRRVNGASWGQTSALGFFLGS